MTLSDLIARTVALAEPPRRTALRRFLRERSRLALTRLRIVTFAGRPGVTPERVYDAVVEATARPFEPKAVIADLLAVDRLADRLTAGRDVLAAAGADPDTMVVE